MVVRDTVVMGKYRLGNGEVYDSKNSDVTVFPWCSAAANLRSAEENSVFTSSVFKINTRKTTDFIRNRPARGGQPDGTPRTELIVLKGACLYRCSNRDANAASPAASSLEVSHLRDHPSSATNYLFCLLKSRFTKPLRVVVFKWSLADQDMRATPVSARFCESVMQRCLTSWSLIYTLVAGLQPVCELLQLNLSLQMRCCLNWSTKWTL